MKVVQLCKKRLYRHPIIWVFGLVIFFASCKKEHDPPAVVADKFLVNHILIGKYDKATLVGRLASFPAAAATVPCFNSLKAYSFISGYY